MLPLNTAGRKEKYEIKGYVLSGNFKLRNPDAGSQDPTWDLQHQKIFTNSGVQLFKLAQGINLGSLS